MSIRRVTRFVDTLVFDRRSESFNADPDDIDTLRTAITLRAGSVGSGCPDEKFVDRLHRELAREIHMAEAAPARPALSRRLRPIMAVAAAVTIVGATATATAAADRVLARPPHSYAALAGVLRTATFHTADGRAIGQIVAYRGDPSWVFMSVHDPAIVGSVRCEVEMNDAVVATGTFVISNGVGAWARPVSSDTSRFRLAALVAPSGSVLATARFSEN